jgi:hypothetical protein
MLDLRERTAHKKPTRHKAPQFTSRAILLRSAGRVACVRGSRSSPVGRKVMLFGQHVAYVALGASDLPRDGDSTHPFASKPSDLNASILAARWNIDRATPKALAKHPRGVHTKCIGQRVRSTWNIWYTEPRAAEIVGELARGSVTQLLRDHVERQPQLLHFHPPLKRSGFWPLASVAASKNSATI